MRKPRWQRLIIAFAGPAINIVLAVALLAGLFMVHFPKSRCRIRRMIGYVAPDGAAAKAGFRKAIKSSRSTTSAIPTWEDIAMKEVASARQPARCLGEARRRAPALHRHSGARTKSKASASPGWAQETRYSQWRASLPGIDAAQNAGLRSGDILVSANGQPIRSASGSTKSSARPRQAGGSGLLRNGQEHPRDW